MFNNKKGIELSVNFIVMLILAVVVFAGGLIFATKFFVKAETMRASLDSETERQLEKLLDSGSPVVLPISTKEIFRKKYDTFGLGILAKYDDTYIITPKFVSAFDREKQPIPNTETDPLGWVSVSPTSLTLTKNQKGKVLILVQVPAEAQSGTYIFQFDVTRGGIEYDNPVQLIIKVP